MKLFSLLLGAALVSGASAAALACATCRAGGFVATCTSATVDLTCKVPLTGAGNFLDKTTDAAKPQCKACANAHTKTCTSATVATACHGAFGIDTAGAVKTCTACSANCATCISSHASACKTCVAGKFGGASAGAPCVDCELGNGDTGPPLTCTSATDALTCPANSILSGATGSKSCTACKSNTKTCTAGAAGTKTTASTVSVTCLNGFGGAAGSCATSCQAEDPAAVADKRAVPLTCASATKALTCPVGSVLGGPAASASCVKCSANTLTCTKSAELLTQVSTISTKCSPGWFIKAGTGTARTCDPCTAAACATATVPKKFATAALACPLGTETADPGLAATNCGTCQGGATCTAASLFAPAAALTCATGSTKRVGTSAATKCLVGAFGDNVSECFATPKTPLSSATSASVGAAALLLAAVAARVQ